MLKGPQDVAPVFVENPHRIEALLLCHFSAMLTEALIEREIRASMKTEEIAGIPLYPELRNCPAPSAPRILEIFKHGPAPPPREQWGGRAGLRARAHPTTAKRSLELLHVPVSAYTSAGAS